MRVKLLYLQCMILSVLFLTACGGGSGGGGSSNNSSSVAQVSTYTTGNKPGKVTYNSVEIFPTMIVTIDFKSNINESDLDRLSVVVRASADDVPDNAGNEFAYILEANKTLYKWTYGDRAGYCCSGADTYYEATNAPGFLRIKIYHYGLHTLNTWNQLKAGIFHINVEANYKDSGLASVISTDYLPGHDIYTTSGLNFTDDERDYLGNDGSADISAVNVEMSFVEY